MKNIHQKYKKAAYHEAGHAIVAEYYGLPWDIVSVKKYKGGGGQGYISNPAAYIKLEEKTFLWLPHSIWLGKKH